MNARQPSWRIVREWDEINMVLLSFIIPLSLSEKK